MKLKMYCFILAALLFSACEEKTENIPSFDVAATSLTGKASENINFNFSGDAGIVYFYSGEVKNDYAFKTGRISGTDSAFLSFSTSVQFGTQNNQLKILASSDFNGDYSIASVQAATWVNITSRFTLATTTTSLSSTEQNITNLIDSEKPLYIAFKYTTLPQTANGLQRTWTISRFNLASFTVFGPSPPISQLSAAWKLVQTPNVEANRSTVSASSGTLSLKGNAVNKEVMTETWAVTKLLDFRKIDFGPDRAVPIKNYLQNRLENYYYKYTKPGVYKAVFIASNTSVYGQNAITKEVTVTVEP
jgi:hypothetical protein